MATVQDILTHLDTIAPFNTAMSWDNCGLICGHKSKSVNRILISLDPFDEAVQEAIRIHADVLLTHHPLIFQPIKNITDDSPIGRSLLQLILHDICAINAHTNLDVAPEGVNYQLAKRLGLQNIEVIQPMGTDPSGREYGLLRKGTVTEQPLSAFLSEVKQALGCPGLRYVPANPAVHTVAVGGGACADEMYQAWAAGCDTFITSDVKYNPFRDAYDLGLNLIDAGHYYTEKPVCDYLYRSLSAAFPEMQITISQDQRDCMNFFI